MVCTRKYLPRLFGCGAPSAWPVPYENSTTLSYTMPAPSRMNIKMNEAPMRHA